MPATNVKDIAEYRRLEKILITAREIYASRRLSRLYNFIVADSAGGQSNETLVNTPSIHLSTVDLQRKIKHIEARLAELDSIELENLQARLRASLMEAAIAEAVVRAQRRAARRESAITAAAIAPAVKSVADGKKIAAEEARHTVEVHTIGNALRKYLREDAKQEFLINIKTLTNLRRTFFGLNLELISDHGVLTELKRLIDHEKLTYPDVVRIVEGRKIAKIITAADEAMILIDNKIFTSTEEYMDCWKIVNLARVLKYAKYQHSKNPKDLEILVKYSAGTKNIFAALSKRFPIELQPLKVLHAMGRYDLIDNFFNDCYRRFMTPEKLGKSINLAVDAICRESARRAFERTVKNYSSLPQQHRDALEEQRAYVIMMRSYLHFAGQDPQSQELRDKLKQDSNLLDQNIKNVVAQHTELAYAAQEYTRIKQELTDIDSAKRWDDRKSKTWNNTTAGPKAIYNYAMPEHKGESTLSNMGKTVLGGSLAAIGWYVGIDAVSSMALSAATATAIAVPIGSFLKADVETKSAKFPKLQQKLALLERTDLNQVDKVVLANMDQFMGYDPETKEYVDSKAKLLVENDNLFKDMYDKYLEQAKEYVLARTADLKELADKEFLRDINLTRTLIEEVLIAAGKTLAGLIFVTGATLLGFLLAVGLTGPIVLFAMSPALSVGLVGAAVVAGLKYMYPDPKLTTVGFLVDATVNAIFAPVKLVISGAEILSRPVMALYNAYKQKRRTQVVATTVAAATFGAGLGVGMPIVAAMVFGAPVIGVIGTAIGSLVAGTYLALTAAAVTEYVYNKVLSNPKVQAFKLERTLEVLNLADKHLAKDYAAINKMVPELLPTLTRLFKSEVETIKAKIDAAISGKPDIDLKQASEDLSTLESWWATLKDKGNNPLSFAMTLEVFLSARYKNVRDSYESVGKHRAEVEAEAAARPYVEPVRQHLSFSQRPSFAMTNVAEYSKDQQSLRDVQSLKHHERLIKRLIS